ncbi:MAG: ankyrin repeat domain-containing protein [Alphaproteobacteria bacterium]|nr:ankyrin repeat domain-containing protein [Alphaproteobacteria bacterium]
MTHETPQEKGLHLIAELRKPRKKCDTTLCLQLIDDGAALNAQDNDGGTALIHAAWKGHTDIVHTLLDKGAAMDVQDNEKNTALIYAIYRNHPSIAHALLNKGAAMDTQNNHGNTALIYAVYQEHTDISHTLLNKGADAGLKTNEGKTAWDIATEKGYHALAQIIHDYHTRQTFTAAAAAGTTQPRKIRRPAATRKLR